MTSERGTWGIWLVEVHGRPVNQWLETYDPDAPASRAGQRTSGWNGYPTGWVTSTDDPRRARRYPNAYACMAEWKRVSASVPTRPDGEPNRPLSAFTIQPAQLPLGALVGARR